MTADEKERGARQKRWKGMDSFFVGRHAAAISLSATCGLKKKGIHGPSLKEW